MKTMAEGADPWHYSPMPKGSKRGTASSKPKLQIVKKSPPKLGVESPDVTERLQILFLAFQDRLPTHTAFATKVGLSYNQWNNIHSLGFPLGKDAAHKLRRAFPGLSTDWLWFGDRRALSYDMAERLDRASLALKGNTEAS